MHRPVLLDYRGSRGHLYVVREAKPAEGGGYRPSRFVAIYCAPPFQHEEVLAYAHEHLPHQRDIPLISSDLSAYVRLVSETNVAEGMLRYPDGRFEPLRWDRVSPTREAVESLYDQRLIYPPKAVSLPRKPAHRKVAVAHLHPRK